MSNKQNTSSFMPIVVVLLTLLVIGTGYIAYNSMHDNRTTGERLSDAADEMSNGLDNAADELKDKSPAEQVGDSVKDAVNGKN